ncbi:MAG: tail fiber protein [Pseudomonadota bacterium]
MKQFTLSVPVAITLAFFLFPPVAGAENAVGKETVIKEVSRIAFIPFPGKRVLWQGEWNEGTSYRQGDGVQLDGSSYYCTQNHTSTTSDYPPNPGYWDLMTAGGAIGSQGPEGPQGPQGLTGPQGNPGTDGATGPIGPQGTQGLTGPQGTPGTDGATGPIGPQGTQGLTGPQGTPGTDGATGPIGPQGTQGLTGPQGTPGSDGATGPIGPQGTQGLTGPQGTPGADGATGPQGIPGPTYTGTAPINVNSTTNTIGLNAATNAGDLISWNGSNWVAIPPAVKSVTHDNMQPWLGINYIIALYGIFPSRSSAEPFIAEISLFAGNFAPRDWAYCDGQLLSISSNTALFSLLGTTYGGNGTTTFALPDLRGRVPVHPGAGPGLSPRTLGGKGGVESLSH